MIHETIGDGNCLFHALLDAFFIPYRTGNFKGKKVTKRSMVRHLRKALAKTLKGKYTRLADGHLPQFAMEIPEFRLDNMVKELASENPIGFGFLEHISNEIEKDIYVLDATRRDIYITGEDRFLQQGRNSIVLIYIPGHFSLGGWWEPNGVITHFRPDHPFITALRARYPP